MASLHKDSVNTLRIATLHDGEELFNECVIPNYDKCKQLVLELSNRLIKVARLISWDIVVDDDVNHA